MTIARGVCLLALAVLAACGAASEGGVTGTGISAISGNVSAVRELGALGQDAALPFPIHVAIAEFPALDTTTDEAGAFQLRGAFSGAITLRFSNADDRGAIGELALEIPLGSQTVLENIEIRTAAPPPERVQPQAVLQFDAFGRVDVVECAADGSGVLLLTDQGRPSRQFMASLTADTEIVARNGTPLTCADLRPGAPVSVTGIVRRGDRTIIARRVVVAARPPQPSPSPRPEALRGIVFDVMCRRGAIQVDQGVPPDTVRRIVRLTERTEFRCQGATPLPCDCGTVAAGDPIGVVGVIFPERPGQVQADVVFVSAGARR